MKLSQFLVVLLGLCLVAAPFTRFATAQEDEYEDEDDFDFGGDAELADDDVVVLTTANFDEMLQKQRFALVEFYAPWCGHCKNLAPAYAAAATALKDHDPPVMIAKVDATEQNELGERFGVQGYPTLKWFVDGEESEYTGGRDEEAIVQWVKKKTGPPAVRVAGAEALAEQEAATDVLVVGYFPKLEGADYAAFVAVAQRTEDVAFVETEAAAAAAAAGLKSAGIAIVKNFAGEERETVLYSGALSEEALGEWIKGEKLPLTLEFNQANSEKIFGAGIPRHLLLVGGASDFAPGAPAAAAFRDAAAALKGRFVFVTVNADGADAEPVVKFFDLDAAAFPTLVGFEMEPKQRKFLFCGGLTAAEIRAFADGVLDGSIQPEYKSEDVPADELDDDVRVVVGKTFDAIVKDPSRDVLLEVYAPWCGHCKSLAPIYAKLAKRFKAIDSVVIAKLDGTANEHPDLDVQGFPTLLFFPAEEGAAGIAYDGERTLKDMTKYIKEHAKIPYELKKKAKVDEADSDADAKDEL